MIRRISLRSLIFLVLLLLVGCGIASGPSSTTATPPAGTEPSPTLTTNFQELAFSPLMEKALASNEGETAFRLLPKQVQPMVAKLNENQVRELQSGTEGESQFGPFTVDHRSAFVKGRVAGKSVWGTIQDKITKAAEKGKMTEQEAIELNKLIDASKPLSSAQRVKMLEFLDVVEVDESITTDEVKSNAPSNNPAR